MLLVAMVVTLSLPMPDMGTCQFFVTEVNHEIANAFMTLRNEIPVSAPDKSTEIVVKEISPVTIEIPVTEIPEVVTKSAKIESKSIESPADLAFELIQEEFAREASEFTIQEAKAALARIGVKPVELPLPPAPAAEDLILPASDLAQVNVVKVIRVTSPDGVWDSLSFMKPEFESNPFYILTIESSTESSSLGDWELITAQVCPLEESWLIPDDPFAKTSVKDDVDNILEVSTESEWLAILSSDQSPMSRVEPDHHDLVTSRTTPPENAPKAVIKNAIRLTAEAIAAWSQLVTKAY
jgi:hypothetical protein